MSRLPLRKRRRRAARREHEEQEQAFEAAKLNYVTRTRAKYQAVVEEALAMLVMAEDAQTEGHYEQAKVVRREAIALAGLFWQDVLCALIRRRDVGRYDIDETARREEYNRYAMGSL